MQGASDLLVQRAVSGKSVGLSDLWLEDQGNQAHWLVGRLNTVTLVFLAAHWTEDQWSCAVLKKTWHGMLAERGKAALRNQKRKDFNACSCHVLAI